MLWCLLSKISSIIPFLQITEIDRDRRRLLVSLKSCDCYPDKPDKSKEIKNKNSVDWLVDYVKERDEILESLHLKSSELNILKFGKFRDLTLY